MFWNVIFIIYLVGIFFLVKIKALLPAGLLLVLFPVFWSLRKYGSIDGKVVSDNSGVTNEKVEEAKAILEIEDEVSEEGVKQAYNRLIKKVHPDHGGSKYLTEQITDAKETLLDYLKHQGSGTTKDE